MDARYAKKLKSVLDAHLASFDFDARRSADPVYYPHIFKNTCDAQAAAVIASCFSYGQIKQFFGVIGSIIDKLKILGSGSPYSALLNYDSRAGALGGLNYRFNKSVDIEIFIEALGAVFKKFGPPVEIIEKAYSKSDVNMLPAVSALVEKVMAYALKISESKYGVPLASGVTQLMPEPSRNSTCKRLCMLMRWFTRGPDRIDLGIIKKIPPSKLIIPLDTHIFRISKMLGLTARRDQSLKTAIEITEALKIIDKDDPVKYDFALCHTGISGLCKKGREGYNCQNCPLDEICLKN